MCPGVGADDRGLKEKEHSRWTVSGRPETPLSLLRGPCPGARALLARRVPGLTRVSGPMHFLTNLEALPVALAEEAAALAVGVAGRGARLKGLLASWGQYGRQALFVL